MSIEDSMREVLDGIYALRDSDGRDITEVFQTLPGRALKEYYRIIQRPISLYRVKSNVKQQVYKSLNDFLKDCVQITHNARVFNMPASPIYQDAVTIDNYIKEQIPKLQEKFPDEKVEYPDLGPIPDQDELIAGGSAGGSGTKGDDDEDEDEDEEDDDEDEDDEDDDDDDDEEVEEEDVDDDDEDAPKRRGRPRRSVVEKIRKQKEEDEEEAAAAANQEDKRRRRGRPPTVDKPHEHRIKAIMRGVRKSREPRSGRMHYLTFEKLPDPKLYPEYYSQVSDPIALDIIRKNIKRRKYSTVEMYLADMTLMFNNAKMFNADGSQVYKDAELLQNLMIQLAEEEMKKPDSVYQDPDSNSKTSRLPLDQVEHRGEIYKVGDWIHIANLNDPTKPTIGQIFRIWQAADGQKWINACWYYRPEQTVHRYDKLFYENEVVKSGQYQDHLVDEILEKCFVMFFTKYQRGRPAGIGSRAVYCCESRYNETEKTFNKIRTWKACIPDEVRSTDYPMDLYEKLHPLRRVVSPIRHLLPENAKDDDPIPEAKLGVANAPPVIGAVYKRPIDPDDPPEQPTPDTPEEDYATKYNTLRNSSSTYTKRLSNVGSNQNSPYNGPSGHANQSLSNSVNSKNNASPFYPLQQGDVITGSVSPAAGYAIPGYGRAPMYAQMSTGPSDRYNPPQLPSSTYKLPEAFQSLLPTSELDSVIRTDQEQVMAWFASPPVWIPDRHLPDSDAAGTAAPLGLNFEFERPHKRSGDNEDEDEGKDVFADVVRPAKRFGHSAKYLAWRASLKA